MQTTENEKNLEDSFLNLKASYETSDSEDEQFTLVRVTDDGEPYIGKRNGRKSKLIRNDETTFVSLNVSKKGRVYVDFNALNISSDEDEDKKKIQQDEIKKIEKEDQVDALLKLAAEKDYPEELLTVIHRINEFKDREFSEDQTLLVEDANLGKYATSDLIPKMKPKRYHVDELKHFLYNDHINSHQSLESTPLMYACLNGHEEVVRILLEAGSELKPKEQQNGSAMNDAARGGHIGVAKVLLKHGAKVYQEEPIVRANEVFQSTMFCRSYYCSPLTLACLNDRMEMFRFLIEAGKEEKEKPQQMDEYRACLLLACAHGNLEMAKFILELGVEPNFEDPCSKETPYTLAAASGSIDLVRLLLRHGSRADFIERTPLMAAVCHQLMPMVNYLLAVGGSDVNAKCERKTAFEMACSNGNLTIADTLLKAGADFRIGVPLILAAKKGHSHVIRYLLHLGVELNRVNQHDRWNGGYSALSQAASYGHRNVVELLVSAGADLEHVCTRLETPLMKASREGHLSVMQYLIDHGAECNTSTSFDGYTSLAIASLGNKPAAVTLLLQNGADIYFNLPNGSSVIMMARIHGFADVMDVFDQHMGVNALKESNLPRWRLSMYRGDYTPNITEEHLRDRRMINALGIACARGDYSLLPIFLERGAKLECADQKGLTPLVIAALAGQEKVVRAILSILGSYSTLPKIENIFYEERILLGLTPVGAAAFSGHLGIFKRLLEFGAELELKIKRRFDFTPLMLAAASGHVEIVKLLIENGADVNAMLTRVWQ